MPIVQASLRLIHRAFISSSRTPALLLWLHREIAPCSVAPTRGTSSDPERPTDAPRAQPQTNSQADSDRSLALFTTTSSSPTATSCKA